MALEKSHYPEKVSIEKQYTCPMHPQIIQKTAGTCPICGMVLLAQKHAPSHAFHKKPHHDFQKRFWISLILTIPILLLSPMIRDAYFFSELFTFPGNTLLLFLLSSVVYGYGGYPFVKGLYDELKAKRPGMMTLIGLSISVAYLYSSMGVFRAKNHLFFWELATLIDIMLLGHWIEMKSVLGASVAIEELAKLLPSLAHKILPDETIQDIPLEELLVNDRVLIRPGEKIPADGLVIEGESSVNEAMLTGESTLVIKQKESSVIGGSINSEGSIQVKITKRGNDSFLSQVIALVKAAQESKSKTQDLANYAAFWLTILAIVGGILTFLIWTFFSEQSIDFALERAVTVMVIACPHALGLAVPLVVAVSTAIAAKKGVFIRNRAAFETARNIQVAVFDKTGTLTLGEFGITDIVIFDRKINEEELLNFAGSIEMHSEHPIAKAISRRRTQNWSVDGFRSISGVGAEGIVKGKNVQIVRPSSIKENDLSLKDPRMTTLFAQGKTVVFVIIDHQMIGAIALSDMIRQESKEAIEKLKKMHIQCMMITGDNRYVGKWVAEELHLDHFFAEVLPKEKAEKIKEIQDKKQIVAMVGDGVNDAPALAAADVGIAIGAGTDIAIESADIILVRNNPMDVVTVMALAKATYRKMAQNLLWATGYNLIAIPMAAGILYPLGLVLTPALGAVFMSLSTIICAINAKLLKTKH